MFREIVAAAGYDRDMKHMLRLALAALALVGASVTSPVRAADSNPVDVRILAINDFHGNLRPPAGGIRITDPDDNTKKIAVPAGGAEYMATLVRALREGHANTIFVAAGDLIGARRWCWHGPRAAL